MRLLNVSTNELQEFPSKDTPPYAILSHRWETEEVSFRAFLDGEGPSLRGWSKLKHCCELARNQGLQYVWIDTCCIDKSSSMEVSEAVNSMYRWYGAAVVCYAYIADVSCDDNGKITDESFLASAWWSRGWTMQELIAPSELIFYDYAWKPIGERSLYFELIEKEKKIKERHIRNPKSASIATRMSWASMRETTREEDIAYCLLGIFDVNMPLLYGEGSKKAFFRLQLEILRQSDDETIFAWFLDGTRSGLLASSPAAFRDSQEFERAGIVVREPYYMTNQGLVVKFGLLEHYPDGPHGIRVWSGLLNCSEDKAPLMIHLIPKFWPIGAKNRRKNPSGPFTHFCRVGPLTRAPSHISKVPAQSTCYVRQDNDLNWLEGFEGLHKDYGSPVRRPTTWKPASAVWHIDNADVERKAFMWSLTTRRGLEDVLDINMSRETRVGCLQVYGNVSNTQALLIHEDILKILNGLPTARSLLILRNRNGQIV